MKLSMKYRKAKRNEDKSFLYNGEIALPKGSVTSFPATERFRILRAKIERLNLKEKSYKALAVTSAVPEEGKSLVAVNLARALSLDPQGKTLLIDGDLRRPSIHLFFQLPREGGLSDVIYGQETVEKVLRPVTTTLDVITAGNELRDPTQAFDGPEFKQLIDYFSGTYRYVIVDCPPILLCPEPITISSAVDSTLLVIRAWRTSKKLVNSAVRTLGPSQILGVVFNDGQDHSRQYAEYGYYGYSYGDKQSGKTIDERFLQTQAVGEASDGRSRLEAGKTLTGKRGDKIQAVEAKGMEEPQSPQIRRIGGKLPD